MAAQSIRNKKQTEQSRNNGAQTRWPLISTRRVVAALLLLLLAGCSPAPTLESAGGVVLVYEFEHLKDKFPDSEIEAAVRSRLDVAGSLGVAVRVLPSSTLEVVVPGKDAEVLQRCKLLMRSSCQIRLRIVADPTSESDLVAPAMALASDKNEVVVDGKAVASWVPSSTKSDGRPLAEQNRPDAPRYRFGEINREHHIVRMVNGEHQLLLLHTEDDVDNSHFATARQSLDASGNPAIAFTMTNSGAAQLKILTTVNNMRQMAIVFDGYVVTAPVIRSPISERGMITGDFDEEEIKFMEIALRSGDLPIKVKHPPISEENVEPEG